MSYLNIMIFSSNDVLRTDRNLKSTENSEKLSDEFKETECTSRFKHAGQVGNIAAAMPLAALSFPPRGKYIVGSGSCWSCNLSEIVRHLFMEICLCQCTQCSNVKHYMNRCLSGLTHTLGSGYMFHVGTKQKLNIFPK